MSEEHTRMVSPHATLITKILHYSLEMPAKLHPNFSVNLLSFLKEGNQVWILTANSLGAPVGTLALSGAGCLCRAPSSLDSILKGAKHKLKEKEKAEKKNENLAHQEEKE